MSKNKYNYNNNLGKNDLKNTEHDNEMLTHANNKSQHYDNKKYSCLVCHYNTNNKYEYDKHTLTAKHQMLMNCEEPNKIAKQMICSCGKKYKHQSSFSRHKKMCHSNKDKKDTTENNVNITPELVIELIKNNNEFKNIIVEQNTKIEQSFSTIMEQNNTINNLVKNGINNTTNNNITNNNNKTFNLQVFLNETCKDAMNISDFVNSIHLGLSDFERIGEVGYAQGISDIITSNLKALDITQRPVHCTDKKREIMYVKDQDVWEKEDENKTKIKKMIKRIENKNIQAIPQFQKKYPNFSNPKSRESDKFHKTIIEAMGGAGGSEGKEGKIIRNISKHVTIDK